ncbi:MAG TPA: c-type cytochrome, partial [Planctomycetota bacterium]|nr:c-type cytochrome [Planctomycetota bacterium]
DGLLYHLLGDHGGFPLDRLSVSSPVRRPHGGLLCRMDLDARSIEVLADGMRNAYDFDFTPEGDVFTWDSDSERNEGLPWYRPCRLYHLTPGASCGWRSPGTAHVPRHAVDAIEPAAEVHRGSPTGVLAYRHDAFPPRYQRGIFALDWTFGRVYFFPLRELGSTLVSEAETFLSAADGVNFAPTDAAVDVDGSILVSSGGRGIAGALHRISSRVRAAERAPSGPLDAVLRAPDPLSAWSRARWSPPARALGAGVFLSAIEDPRRDAFERIRALEVIVDLFPAEAARAVGAAAGAEVPGLRAAAARWAGRFGDARSLLRLLRDPHPRVRREASESAPAFRDGPEADALARRVLSIGAEPDQRLRSAAIASLARFDPGSFSPAEAPGEKIALGFALVLQASWGRLPESSVELGLSVLSRGAASSREEAVGALRLLQAGFDRLKARQDLEHLTFDPEWDRVDLKPHREIVDRALEEAAAHLDDPGPAGTEALRLTAQLRAPSAEAASRVAARLGMSSDPGDDMFVLWCLARMPAAWTDETARGVVSWAVDFPRKLQGGVERDAKWGLFARAIWERLLAERPSFARLLVEADDFGDAEHVDVIAGADAATRQRAARRFLERPLPGDASAARRVLELLARDGPADAREKLLVLFRSCLQTPGLRAPAIAGLASMPVPEDREHFVEALEDGDPALLEPALRALACLPASAEPLEDALVLLRRGFEIDADSSRAVARDLIAARLEVLTGDSCGFVRGGKGPRREALECWVRLLQARFPDERDRVKEVVAGGRSGEDLIEFLLAGAPWEKADADRGKAVFAARGCVACHHVGGVGQRVGPDLAGVARRLGRRELLVEIVDPSRNVPERFQVTVYELRTGERIEGAEIYRARSSLLLVTREGTFRRPDPAEIVSEIREPSSLMPTGLLTGLEPQAVADLVAFLEGAK